MTSIYYQKPYEKSSGGIGYITSVTASEGLDKIVEQHYPEIPREVSGEINISLEDNVVKVRRDKGPWGYLKFKIEGFPAQCGIVMYTHFDDYDGDEDLYTAAFSFADDIVKAIGYTKVVMTHVVRSNVHKIALALDWKEAFQFKNNRSENQVALLEKDL